MTDPMQAAIEAATKALNGKAVDPNDLRVVHLREERTYSGLFGLNGDAGDIAEIAYAAIEPLVRKAVADELRQAVAEQSSWLWFELGESALLKVADHIAPRGERA